MWGDSWINLAMKMQDMPYFQYSGTGKGNTEEDAKEGTVDILKTKFAKYINK